MPTLNEELGLKLTLEEIPLDQLEQMGLDHEIIVVDGNSSDKTREIATTYGARVILEPCKGYGRAYKTGFEHARGQIIVTLDGDNSYPPLLIPSLIKNLLDENLDFVTTNRFANAQRHSFSLLHRLGNRVLSFAFKVLFSASFKDSQSGMWVVRRTVVPRILPDSDSMSFSQEIKIRAYHTCRCAEVPISYRRRVGTPKIRTLRDGGLNLVYLVRLRILSNIKGSSKFFLDGRVSSVMTSATEPSDHIFGFSTEKDKP